MKAIAKLAIVGAAWGVAALSPASAATCDRACLRSVLDQYLNAVVKHDPKAAPLAVGVRQTENALSIAPGEGVWKSITALGKLQRRYLDPVNESAGFYGTVAEGASGSIVTLRLKIEDRKVSEAEWIVARANTGTPAANGPGSTSVEGAESAPPPEGPVAKDKRLSRSALIGLANGYFDSIQTGNTALFISDPNYIRLENGIGTGAAPVGARRGGGANNAAAFAGLTGPAAPGGARAGGAGPAAGGGRAAGPGPADGICGGICAVAARRFPIIDEEAGVVLGMVVFLRPPGAVNRRNLLSEWFTADSGKIRGIYAAMHYLAPTIAAPNWPPYDANFPMATYLPGADVRTPALAP